MKFRKTKYDKFLFYDPDRRELLIVQWDTACNFVDRWFHYNGKKAWWIPKNGYLKDAHKKYVLIDRFPEWVDV